MVEVYKLVGFINLFDVIPDFVFPVFEFAGKFYFQHGDQNQITEFIEIREDILPRIIPLPRKTTITITLQSDPIYAFQCNENTVEYGEASYLKEYLVRFDTQDVILKKEIKDFFDEVSDHLSEYLPAANCSCYHAVGRRKKAIARVRLLPGMGNIIIRVCF